VNEWEWSTGRLILTGKAVFKEKPVPGLCGERTAKLPDQFHQLYDERAYVRSHDLFSYTFLFVGNKIVQMQKN
jgi:hypothetical protein